MLRESPGPYRIPPCLRPAPPPLVVLQSTKAHLEKERKTNAKTAREQRQALQMTHQVESGVAVLDDGHPSL